MRTIPGLLLAILVATGCGGPSGTDGDLPDGDADLADDGEREAERQTTGWALTLPGAGPLALAATGDGGLLVAGRFEGTVDFDPGPGADRRDAGSGGWFAARYAQDGRHAWSWTVADRPGHPADGCAIAAARDGGAAVAAGGLVAALRSDGSERWRIDEAGRHPAAIAFGPDDALTSTGAIERQAGMLDLFVARHAAADGHEVWIDRFAGLDESAGTAVVVSDEGGVAVAGTFRGMLDFDPAPDTARRLTAMMGRDLFLLRLDPAGRFLWVRHFGAASDDERIGPLAVGPGNTLLAAGSFTAPTDLDPGDPADVRTPAGNRDGFLAALGLDGVRRWAATYGGAALQVDTRGVAAGADGLAVAGEAAGSGNLAVDAGDMIGPAAVDGSAAWLLALDPAGTPLWVRSFPDAAGTAAASAPDGGYYLAGRYESEAGGIDFDPGSGSDLHPEQTGRGMFLLRLDRSGGY